ncbi:MAG: thioredoxin [Nitrospirota bacterium]|nr:thioredoxin [Nitrospirota bacterium]
MTQVPIELTDDTFDKEVLQENGVPVLVDFWAPWCGPCRIVSPIVEELAAQHTGKLKVAKMNVDDNPKTPSTYGIRGIPTLILFKEGQVADQIVGAVPKAQIEEVIQKVLS